MSTVNLKPGDAFPTVQLPDHEGNPRELSHYTRIGEFDRRLGFEDGYPLIVVFYRGFFCPRDQAQMRLLVEFQNELAVSFCKLVAIGVQPPLVHAGFRAGLGATFPFLADEHRALIRQVGILDRTEGEYVDTAQPYTFVLRPDMTIHKIYDGWFFVARPTIEELRRDLREIMSEQSYYPYEAWDVDEVKAIRIPQSAWVNGAPELGANGLPVAHGTVKNFNFRAGSGVIERDDGEAIFFNFTAIPGEGYRTIAPGTAVRFEVVETQTGLSARNIQRTT
ncbi:MAG: redoxin domain-containing protein [Chloroflexota bacterium]